MSELFHNLPMETLSKSDYTILSKFDAINKLNKSLNDFLRAEVLAFETESVSRMMPFLISLFL